MKKWLILLVGFFFHVGLHAQPLPAQQAFAFSSVVLDSQTLELQWVIAPHYFLYQKSLRYQENLPTHFTLGDQKYPKPDTRLSAQGKKQAIYRHTLRLSIPIIHLDPGETQLRVFYQGCSDEGFCYPPEQVLLRLTVNAQGDLTQSQLETSLNTPPQTMASQPLTSPYMPSGHWWLVLFSFYGFGLLLSLTPCVLPMIPILSGIIVGHGPDLSTKKAFFLSLSYVVSMSLTYSVIGAFIALMGHNIQVAMQSPWWIGFLSFLFILIALSMFDYVHIQLPQRWQAKLASLSPRKTQGHYATAWLMGCLSTLVLSPCVTGPLIGALGYIAQRGQVGLGMSALFILGFGMGTPLLLIGASAGKLLPKAGTWMNGIKALFGVFFLALSIHLLERLLPSLVIMHLWGVLLIYCAFFMGTFQRAQTKIERGLQATGVILFIYGTLILIGASTGHHNPLHPLTDIAPTPLTANEKNQPVTTLSEVTSRLEQARGQPIILDFYADWCTSCRVIQDKILPNPRIQHALNHAVLITVDLSKNQQDTRDLLQYFHVTAPPAFLFFNADGQELESLRWYGEITVNELLDRLMRQASP